MLANDWGVAVGDIVRTKKAHPCGSDVWRVIRTGADIKIRCQGCGRIVMLARADFLKRVKQVVAHATSEGETHA
nr:DUF951 domain-containing protein [Maliibacterium massiliense]